MRESETWRPVVGYEGDYEVSNFGSVVSLKRGNREEMAPLRQASGHLGVSLCRSGVKVRHRIHRLVLAAFVGPCPDGMEVRHLDGDPANNYVGNLTYGTASENRADAYRHGGRRVGQRSHLAKLSDAEASEIMHLRGIESSRKVAARYGVNDSYVREMWRGKSRTHGNEAAIESALVDATRAAGGEIRKLAWVGRKGAPDRVVMLPGGRTIFVELKRPGGLATFPVDARERAQLREHERMRKMGQRVVVIDSIEGVEELLS